MKKVLHSKLALKTNQAAAGIENFHFRKQNFVIVTFRLHHRIVKLSIWIKVYQQDPVILSYEI